MCVISKKIRGVPNSHENHYRLSIFNTGGWPAEAQRAVYLYHSDQNASLERVLKVKADWGTAVELFRLYL